MRLDRFYERIGTMLPPRTHAWFANKLLKGGMSEDVNVWIGRRAILSIIGGIVASYIPVLLWLGRIKFFTIDFSTLELAEVILLMFFFLILGIAVTAFSLYLVLYYIIIERAERVEKVLPEFLMMVSSNLRAGMTPFNAFKRSATPELGPLEREIQLASVKANSSQSLTKALTSLSERIDSKVLERTVKLFDKSVRAGGQIAELLMAISEEVRRNQELKSELISSTKSYTVFLFFIIVLISPALLSVSAQFLSIYANIRGQFTATSLEGFSLPFFSGNVSISMDFAIMVSYMSLIGTSFFSSMLMGAISRGKPLYGVKYFPLLAIGSIIAFQIGLQVAKSVFSTF